MHETVDKFREATFAYEAAKKAAEEVASDLRVIGYAMSHGNVDKFLALNYGMRLPRRSPSREDLKFKLDMSQWPTPETVNTAFRNLASAFNALHAAWDAVPADEKSFLRGPDDGTMLKTKDPY